MTGNYKLMNCRMLAALGCLLAVACSSGDSTAPDAPAGPTVRRVVMVSVDGLRGDALEHMPSLAALRGRARWTDSMETVAPSLTVPGHLSMFTGRDVTRLGITGNSLDEAAGAQLVLGRATSIFEWVRNAGGRSAALVGTSLVPAADLERAREFFEIDEIVSVGADVGVLGPQAVAAASAADAPTLLFVHVPTVDFAGHDHGWIRVDTTGADGRDVLGTQYLAAAREVDAALGALWRALQPAIERGEVALLVTSDHGGGHGEGCVEGAAASREHCTSRVEDRAIPFVLVARGVAPGRVAGRPSITQVAPTVGRLLGLEVPGPASAALRF